jgi:hypothetical protein
LGRLGEKLAQGPPPGGRVDGVFCGDKGEETPAAVRFDCMTQVNRLGTATIGCGLSPPDVRVCKGHATFRRVPESWEV